MLANNVNLTIFGGQPGNQFRLGCSVQATNGDTISIGLPAAICEKDVRSWNE